MKKKPEELQPNQIIDLLTPLVDIPGNLCSVSKFTKNPETSLEKMRVSQQPLVLTLNGKIIGVVYEPSSFINVEDRRKKLIALLKEPVVINLRAVKRPLTDPKVLQLERCILRIEALQRKIAPQKALCATWEDELRNAEEEKHRLLSILNVTSSS